VEKKGYYGTIERIKKEQRESGADHGLYGAQRGRVTVTGRGGPFQHVIIQHKNMRKSTTSKDGSLLVDRR